MDGFQDKGRGPRAGHAPGTKRERGDGLVRRDGRDHHPRTAEGKNLARPHRSSARRVAAEGHLRPRIPPEPGDPARPCPEAPGRPPPLRSRARPRLQRAPRPATAREVARESHRLLALNPSPPRTAAETWSRSSRRLVRFPLLIGALSSSFVIKIVDPSARAADCSRARHARDLGPCSSRRVFGTLHGLKDPGFHRMVRGLERGLQVVQPRLRARLVWRHQQRDGARDVPGDAPTAPSKQVKHLMEAPRPATLAGR